MTYTTYQAIALAREVGSLVRNGDHCFDDEELTALCNAVRKQVLLEAADEFDRWERWEQEVVPSAELRRMAGVE